MLISKGLIDSNITHEERTMFKKQCSLSDDVMIWKKKSKMLRFEQYMEDFSVFIKQCYCIVSTVEGNTESIKP